MHRFLKLRVGAVHRDTPGFLGRFHFGFDGLGGNDGMHCRLQLAEIVRFIFRQIHPGDQATARGRWLDQQFGDFVSHLVAGLNQREAARKYQAAQYERNRAAGEIFDDAVECHLNFDRAIVERPTQQRQFIAMTAALIIELQCGR